MERASAMHTDRFGRCGLGLMAVLLAAASVRPAQGQCELEKNIAADGQSADFFGVAIAMSGDVVIVGARGDDDQGFSSGSVYIYRFDGLNWNQETKILASDGAAADAFGISVAVSGDVAVVGAWQDQEAGQITGSAYIYRYNGTDWIEDIKLVHPNGALDGEFGVSVSVSGDVVVVGARGLDDLGSDNGSAYVYRYNGTAWIEETRLLASDGAVGDDFGNAVSVDGNVVFVGAFRNVDAGANTGSVYVSRYDGAVWNEEQKLLAFDATAGDFYGSAVSVDAPPGAPLGQEVAIVGSSHDNDNGGNSGSAYIYRFDGLTWNLQSKILASDGAQTDLFGQRAEISGDVVIVGAYQHDVNGSNFGAAYVYRYNGVSWPEEAKLLASDGMEESWFGWSVAVSGDVVVVGAIIDDDNGPNSGSMYVFDLLCLCPADSNDDSAVNVTDLIGLLGAWGPNPGHAADINGDGNVNVTDLLALLGAWGACP